MNTMLYSELQDKRVKLKEKIPLKTPFGLFIEPTNWCNFKCIFCPRNCEDFSLYAGGFQHLQQELSLKIINDIKKFPDKIKTVRLYYTGEPLLYPDFCSLLKNIVQADITNRIEITTNGSLLTKEISKQILNIAQDYSGTIYLRFSIYSVEQKRHSFITKSNFSIDCIRNNISLFQHIRNKENIKNVITYAKMLNTFTRENEKFLSIYQKIVDETALEEPMNWSGFGDKNLLDSTYTHNQITQLSLLHMPKACSYPFDTMAIMSDGAVISCCVDWSRQTYIGDVKTESLRDIWNGEKLKELRKLHLLGLREKNKACKNCRRLPCHEEDDLNGISVSVLDKPNI